VTHEQLWAPWRLDYIATAKEAKPEGCFLCHYRDNANDVENLVVARTEHCLVVLNRFPYNNGHLLVAPLSHSGTLGDLNDAALFDTMKTVQHMTRLLGSVLSPHGFNVGLNLGAAAGAGLPDHLHWHIVPRWNGDTNFMPILGSAKVIPQSLRALYDLLNQEMNGNS